MLCFLGVIGKKIAILVKTKQNYNLDGINGIGLFNLPPVNRFSSFVFYAKGMLEVVVVITQNKNGEHRFLEN